MTRVLGRCGGQDLAEELARLEYASVTDGVSNCWVAWRAKAICNPPNSSRVNHGALCSCNTAGPEGAGRGQLRVPFDTMAAHGNVQGVCLSLVFRSKGDTCRQGFRSGALGVPLVTWTYRALPVNWFTTPKAIGRKGIRGGTPGNHWRVRWPDPEARGYPFLGGVSETPLPSRDKPPTDLLRIVGIIASSEGTEPTGRPSTADTKPRGAQSLGRHPDLAARGLAPELPGITPRADLHGFSDGSCVERRRGMGRPIGKRLRMRTSETRRQPRLCGGRQCRDCSQPLPVCRCTER